MPFEVDLKDKKEDNDLDKDKQKSQLDSANSGEFKEIAPDIEIKPEPLAYDDESNEQAAFGIISHLDRAEATLAKAAELEQNDPFRDLRKTVDESAINALIATNGNQRDEFLRFKAMELYNDMHKAAKLFLKDWCIVQHWRQRWTNPFKEQFRTSDQYIPKVYNLDIVNTIDQVTTKNLASMCLIARDACIEGAKKCGFDTSVHRAKVLAKFPEDVLNILFNDPRYLDEQRLMAIENEQRQQIAAMRFVRSDIKERWLRDLTEKFKRGNSNKIV